MNDKTIDGLFEIMDTWRHFPNWQLERRADIFFALFMEEILSIAGITDITGIIPEFPVRVGEVYPDDDTNRSFKIDYVAITKEKVWLVELKTNQESRRAKQDEYLTRSQLLGFDVLLDGILKIYDATKAKDKYRCLLDALCDAGVLVKSNATSYVKRHVYRECEVVYIQPVGNCGSGDDEKVISFRQIVSSGVLSGEIGVRFAESLGEWSDG
ncbi:MAG: hypothetical protein OCD01_19030 [Fibrobacterales bacterium]